MPRERDPEEIETVRRTREEDALHEDPNPMDVAARANSERMPALTQALVRERHIIGQAITLLDSAELSHGVVVVIYLAEHEKRFAVYRNGHPRYSGTLD